jgi:AcrR family transcriptional regulator
VHYHFGSKEGLVEALLARSAQPIVEGRLRLLAACAEAPGRPPLLEQLLTAFIRPSLAPGREAAVDGAAFARLRGRLAVESEAVYRRLLAQAFDASSRQFLAAIQAALPDTPRALVAWRFHFMMGAMVFCQVDNGRIRAISEDAIDPSDREAAISRLVPFLAAGFRAPP